MDAREATLPKWARQELAVARMRASEAEAQTLRMRGDLPENVPCVVLDGYTDRPVRLPLQRVTFQLAHEGRRRDIDITPYAIGRSAAHYGAKDGLLLVQGFGPLRVVPHVTNVLTIAEER